MATGQGTESVSLHRTGTMLVFLQGQDACGLYGSIINGFLREPVKFHGLGELILRLDEICDWINCPRRVSEPRFFNEWMKKEFLESQNSHPEAERENCLPEMDLNACIRAFSAREVVMVYVGYRQNASLQGFVRGRVTEEQYVSFRSALELMRMFSMIQIEGSQL